MKITGKDIMESIIRPALVRASEQPGLTDEWKQEMLRHAEAKDLSDLALDDRRTIGYTFKCLGAGLWALRTQSDDPEVFRSAINQLILAGGGCRHQWHGGWSTLRVPTWFQPTSKGMDCWYALQLLA